MKFSRRELAQRATLTEPELEEVMRLRGPHNRLGFAYQLGFVRLLNRLPAQMPFEVFDDLVLFTALQLRLDPSLIEKPRSRRSALALLRHVSPIEWENVVVYGEYRLDRRRIRQAR